MDLKYPISQYKPQPFSEELRIQWLHDIQMLPQDLERVIENLDEVQINTPYRPDGWTVKQVVHHLCDSHMNAYIRFKLAILEDNPIIKPYNENDWAHTSDVDRVPVNVCTTLLHALHKKWYAFLKDLTQEQLERTLHHPEHQKDLTVWFLLGMYAWHGKHHVAHIQTLIDRNNWK